MVGFKFYEFYTFFYSIEKVDLADSALILLAFSFLEVLIDC